jgi:hypothetical protein
LVEKSQTDDWLHGDESYRELLTVLDNAWNKLEYVWNCVDMGGNEWNIFVIFPADLNQFESLVL